MIRATFFALFSLTSFFAGFVWKFNSNPMCLVAFAVGLLSLFAVGFSLESFYKKKGKSVNY